MSHLPPYTCLWFRVIFLLWAGIKQVKNVLVSVQSTKESLCHDCSLVLDKTSFIYGKYMETSAISAFMSLYKNNLEVFNIFGIIKETGIDDEGLVEYYYKYFTYPLYQDKLFAFIKLWVIARLVLDFYVIPFASSHLSMV